MLARVGKLTLNAKWLRKELFLLVEIVTVIIGVIVRKFNWFRVNNIKFYSLKRKSCVINKFVFYLQINLLLTKLMFAMILMCLPFTKNEVIFDFNLSKSYKKALVNA